MQKMEETDELDRGGESLSNRHILKGFKCVLKCMHLLRATLISIFQQFLATFAELFV